MWRSDVGISLLEVLLQNELRLAALAGEAIDLVADLERELEEETRSGGFLFHDC